MFWSVVGAFVTPFPLICACFFQVDLVSIDCSLLPTSPSDIPKLNTAVFKHAPVTWEIAVPFVSITVFVMLVELWKWAKRVYIRRSHVEEEEEAMVRCLIPTRTVCLILGANSFVQLAG